VRLPLDKIEQDFQAFTQRVNVNHILRLKYTGATLTLKQKIRNRVTPKSSDLPPMHVINAFNKATRRYSLDDETKKNDGMFGELLPQGACRRFPELNKACFKVPLGHVVGSIETNYGYHLLLVEERINCVELYGFHSKIVRDGTDGAKTVYLGPNDKEENSNVFRLTVENLVFWILLLII